MILGCDVSFWQDDNTTPARPDFAKMKAAGAEFVFIRAAYGLSQDSDFVYNWQAAKDAGLLRGAYQWMVWTETPTAQANFFATLLAQDGGELPPIVDYEDRNSVPTSGTAITLLKTYLTQLEGRVGRIPIIYTGIDFWKTYGSSEAYWKRYKLWMAYYIPLTIAPWDKATFIQFTAKGDGHEYGMESLNIDLDLHNGSRAELQALAVTTPPPPPTPTPTPVTKGWFRTGPNVIDSGVYPSILPMFPIPKRGTQTFLYLPEADLDGEPPNAVAINRRFWCKWFADVQGDNNVMAQIEKWDAHVTKGYNNNGKLIWIPNLCSRSIVYGEVVDGVGEKFVKVYGIPYGDTLATPAGSMDYWRYSRPDVMQTLWAIDSNGNYSLPGNLSARGFFPIFGGPWYIPLSDMESVVFPKSVKITLAAGVNVRSGPGTNFPIVGALGKDATVTILDLSPGQAGWWGKYADGKWICLHFMSPTTDRYAGGYYTDWRI